jgi:hypothetical protein
MGSAAGARLGSALFAADIDGDGADELLVTEPGGGEAGAGAVHLLTGGALRSVWGAAVVTDLRTASIFGEAPGWSPAGLAVADTDGDGAAELIIGAAQADGPGTDLPQAGRLYLVPARGVLEGRSVDLAPNEFVAGVTARGFLGRSVSAGDIDYDGIDDLLVSAYGSTAGASRLEATGEGFVLFGGRGDHGAEEAPAAGTGLSAVKLDGPSVPRFAGGSSSDLFGLPVLLADLNGDGADDIVASAQYADGPDDDRNACGEVYVYWGSLRSVMLAKAATSDLANVTIVGASPEDSIGGSLLVLDLDKDGPRSLIVGAPYASAPADDGEELPRCGKLILVPREQFSR